MEHNTPEFQAIKKALDVHGLSVKTFMEKYDDERNELKARVLELEQKGAHKPGQGTGYSDGPGELTQMVFGSDGLKAFNNGVAPAVKIDVPRRLMKSAILNATGQNQPLVAADRRPEIVVAPAYRFTLRDVLRSVETTSNLIEFTRELTFSNNAGPQGGLTSPTVAGGEGETKPQSSMTFELATAPVITLAHWIPASRQVLADAKMLQDHIENRLMWGLKLEEERELLNGSGTAGELSGLVANATAFTGGSTNLTGLDAIAMGMVQLVASGYTPSAIIMNLGDWVALTLAKDTTGRYILGDPQSATTPRLWGLPVVTCSSQTAGQFLIIDALRAGYIVDREDASVRIAEQHADFFVRNLIVVLAEERLGLVITLGAAIVKGAISNAG